MSAERDPAAPMTSDEHRKTYRLAISIAWNGGKGGQGMDHWIALAKELREGRALLVDKPAPKGRTKEVKS